jgi:hypothetical protein
MVKAGSLMRKFNSLVKSYTPEITKKFDELIRQQKTERPGQYIPHGKSHGLAAY